METKEFGEIAKLAARKAGEISMANWGGDLDIEGTVEVENIKKDGQYQLNIDKACERTILDIISEKFPEHNFLCEECGKIDNGSDYTWIIDPLDGSHNYFFRLPTFAVSVALQKEKEVIVGAINFPYFPKMHFAEKGKGAFKNDNPAVVSKRKHLRDGILLYDSSFYRKKEEVFETFSKLAEKTFCLRVFGSTTLNFALVATRKADCAVLHSTKPWDIAAGCFLIEEAGGKVTDFEGKRWTPDSENIVASNGLVHDEVLEIIQSNHRK